MSRRVAFLGSLVGCFLGSSALASQAIYVVDEAGGPGVDFTSLQTAVELVEAGSTLLVHSGTYGDIAPEHALVVHAAAGADVRIESLSVIGLDDARGFALRGASVENVLVQDCQAPIWFEECSVRDTGVAATAPAPPAPAPPAPAPPAPAVEVVASDSVVFLRSSIGMQGASCAGGPCAASLGGGTALRADRAQVYLYDTAVTGGEASFVPGTTPQGAPGGAGVSLSDAFLFASGGSVRGGFGSAGAADFGCNVLETPGLGGHGVVLEPGGAPHFAARGTSVEGGSQGLPFAPSGLACAAFEGEQADPFLVQAGSVDELDGVPRSFEAESPAAESLELSFSGLAGDALVLGVGLHPEPSFVEASASALLLGRPFRAGYVDTLVTGTRELTLPLPGVPVGTRLFTQALFLDDAGDVALAGGSLVLVIE